MDSFERLRGTNLAWFGVDELTYAKPDAWSRLEGRLRDSRAFRRCGFAAWTPKGFDEVWERFIDQPGPDYAAVQAAEILHQPNLASAGVWIALFALSMIPVNRS